MGTSSRSMRGDPLADHESITVAFIEPESPGNIGSLARAMKNFGLSKLLLIGGCPLGEDAWTLAMHAKDVIEASRRISWQNLMDMGYDFYIGTTSRRGHDSNLPRVAISPVELGREMAKVDGEVCMMFGREGNGLSLVELEACEIVVSIPTSDLYPSLNVTHAASVIFYEIFRNLASGPRARMRKANAKEKEVLLGYIDLMIDSSHMPEHRKRSTRLVFRRLISRAFISGRECHTLIGLMKELSPPRV